MDRRKTIVLHSINNENISVSLVSGAWTICVYGLDESGVELAAAETTFTVFSSQNSQINLVLKPMMNDTTATEASGAVSVDIDWSGVNSQFLNDVSVVSALFGLVDEPTIDISSELDVDLCQEVLLLI